MRHSAGAIGLLLLVVGGIFYFQGPQQLFWSSLAIRVGALLAVIWLAWNQIMSLRKRVPGSLIALVGICLLLIAMQPNRGRFLVGLLVAAIGVSGALRWLSRLSGGTPKALPRRGDDSQRRG